MDWKYCTGPWACHPRPCPPIAPRGVPSRRQLCVERVESTVVMHSCGRHHGTRRQPKRAMGPRCAGAPNDECRYRILVNENRIGRNRHRNPSIEAFTVSTQNPRGHDGARDASGSRIAGTPSFTWVNRIQLPELLPAAASPPRWCHCQQFELSRRVKGQVAVRIAFEKRPEPASQISMPGGFCMVAPPVSRMCLSGVFRKLISFQSQRYFSLTHIKINAYFFVVNFSRFDHAPAT